MAGRPKRPVILKKDNAVKRFDSIADAAAWLGVSKPSVIQVLKRRGRRHYIRGFSAEYESDYVSPKEKRELNEDNTRYIGLEVEIEGVTYCSKSMPDKINCTTCEIYKARPPRNMAQVPLCYDHSIGKRRVYNYCESNHTLNWVKK